MLTVPDIIAEFGGSTAFGRVCGFTSFPGARGNDMRRRNSIPPEYWSRIVAEAKAKKLTRVTYEALAAAHAPASSPPPPSEGRPA